LNFFNFQNIMFGKFKFHLFSPSFLKLPWEDISSKPWLHLWSFGHEGPIFKSTWRATIVVIWEHTVGIIIKDGFLSKFWWCK
jgi:hypothetical protein